MICRVVYVGVVLGHSGVMAAEVLHHRLQMIRIDALGCHDTGLTHRWCEGDTTPITLIPISGEIPGDGNHNNRDTLQYESTG